MKLVIGGYAQGKLNYVLQNDCADRYAVFEAELPDAGQMQEADAQGEKVLINHLHCWVKECLLRGGNPQEEIESVLERSKDCTIISDEIGNGIVPIDAFEREYREQTGRILIKLAAQADEVVRVICGIGQKIK